jgi:2-dehydropantoate 2-reductase
MRIAILGAGGIGAPIGASLATSDHDVNFVARGAHLAAMRANGLRVEGDRGVTLVHPVQATNDIGSIGPVDIVLTCVKLWDLETSAEQMRPLIGPDTAVIPMQNGVDASERLIPILGADHVMGGVAMVTGSIIAPGVVRQAGTHHGVIFGELDGSVTPRAERFRDACLAAGITPTLTDDIQYARWEKFVGLAAISGLAALTRQPIGTLRDDPDIKPLFDAAMRENIAVGVACGVRLGPEMTDKWTGFLNMLPATARPSMAVDLIAGNRLELRWLAGKIVELGRVHGVPTRVNDVIYGALKPFADGTPG